MKSYLTLHYTCYIYQVISKDYITLETRLHAIKTTHQHVTDSVYLTLSNEHCQTIFL